ncbi:MAG: isoprenylcysteine carboxylmethyltransferase family protein [Rhizobiales bacterium]|nr:isoprenylcysteine carboxylmethyltransferase family protein [Hyphomicrobiales bacterium]
MNDIATRPSQFPWPPLIFVGATAASILLQLLYEPPWIGQPVSDILFAVGWLLVLAWAALLASALRAMKTGKTTVHPTKAATHLVTSGAFALSRNPIYLGNTLVLIGIGLIAGMAWFPVMALVAAFLTQKLAIEPEEQHLAARFGKKYRDYAKRVRRWI